jgi:hypothetical protein
MVMIILQRLLLPLRFAWRSAAQRRNLDRNIGVAEQLGDDVAADPVPPGARARFADDDALYAVFVGIAEDRVDYTVTIDDGDVRSQVARQAQVALQLLRGARRTSRGSPRRFDMQRQQFGAKFDPYARCVPDNRLRLRFFADAHQNAHRRGTLIGHRSHTMLQNANCTA